MACTPGNTTNTTCEAQTLSLNSQTGDLGISNGNTVNLASTIDALQTVIQLSSFQLNGPILVLTIIAEDGVPQTKFVDLTSIETTNLGFSVINSNSIHLTLLGTTLRADLAIDPNSTLPITAGPNGVYFGCCPETPISAAVTNTIQTTITGTVNHLISSVLKYQSSSSVQLSDSSLGLLATLKYSTDANNAASAGSDGALYVQKASAQLATLPTNGFASQGSSGTLLVGSDSKLYRIQSFPSQIPLIGVNTETVNMVLSGASNTTVSANVNLTNSHTVNLTATVNGVRADVNIDTVTPGNVAITSDANGLVANINEATILDVQNTSATVQNPLTKVYGLLNNGNGGYASVVATQYGVKVPYYTSTQRISIPNADLYDSMLVFDSTLRQYMYYDAINIVWVAISSGSSGAPALKYPHSIFAPLTGNTVNLANNSYNVINPAGTIAALTLSLPSSPLNNDAIVIKYTQSVTSVSYTNGTVVAAVAAKTAGQIDTIVYDSTTTSWY